MKLSAIFSDGAVFSANRPIRVFGDGDGKGKVTFADNTKEVISDGGRWCVEFDAMEYGGPYELTLEADGDKQTVSDVYIGEVYLFSGQSNMAFHLGATNTDKKYYEENENLRLLTVFRTQDGECWKKAENGVFESFSALGYLVGNEISKKKNIKVGVIACAVGASVIESWMPEGTLEKIGINIPAEEKHLDHTDPEYGVWNHDADLYNAMLSKVIPYTLSGVVWYQGESDAKEAEALVYDRELCALIEVWREKFMDSRLPFTIVQIADTDERIAQGPGWKLIQEAQKKAVERTKNAYLVISKDISERDDVHPKSKHGLAKRIEAVISEHYFKKEN